MGENLHDLISGDEFLNTTPRAFVKEKISG